MPFFPVNPPPSDRPYFSVPSLRLFSFPIFPEELISDRAAYPFGPSCLPFPWGGTFSCANKKLCTPPLLSLAFVRYSDFFFKLFSDACAPQTPEASFFAPTPLFGPVGAPYWTSATHSRYVPTFFPTTGESPFDSLPPFQWLLDPLCTWGRMVLTPPPWSPPLSPSSTLTLDNFLPPPTRLHPLISDRPKWPFSPPWFTLSCALSPGPSERFFRWSPKPSS